MHASWVIDETSLSGWRYLVAENKGKDLPKRRHKKNVKREGIDLSKDELWRVLVGCQVTTQQKSGPGSSVSKFMKSKSPALCIRKCRADRSVQSLVERECADAGLRRAPTIAQNLSTIFANLEGGEWRNLLAQLETLEQHTTAKKERKVVEYLLSGKYPGLGQKQSRNFIQWLGLSRYEVPLDSRVLKTLRARGASFVPSGSALTDETVYLFVQDAIQLVAKQLNIYPCELDACIFASFDSNEDVAESDT